MSTNVKSRIRKAAALLLDGKSSKEVSATMKLRRETLSRWKEHPDFIAETERLKEELRGDMRVKLWRQALGAFDTTIDDSGEGLDNQYWFEEALKFFKTIANEPIFVPVLQEIAPD